MDIKVNQRAIDLGIVPKTMEVKLYRLSYEDGEYCVGTDAEVISRHNEWVEASGRFEKEEITNALATTIQDLEEHWTVEQFYTVVLKVEEEIV